MGGGLWSRRVISVRGGVGGRGVGVEGGGGWE